MKYKFRRCTEFLLADLAKREGNKLMQLLKDPISRFHFYLRAVEYLQGRLVLLPIYIFFKFIFLSASKKLSFSIPPNTLGRGVYIPHWGTIVVNSKAYVGDCSVLNVDVVIGRHPSSKLSVPTIGKGVYVAPGVKIYGKIIVGDNCVLAANSVINKNVESRMIMAGIPAVVIGEVNKESAESYGIDYFE